jgi:hypothetical protein
MVCNFFFFIPERFLIPAEITCFSFFTEIRGTDE